MLTTATRLKHLFVKNISAVKDPANRRGWLLMKSTGDIVARRAEPDGQSVRRAHVLDALATHYGARIQTLDGLQYRSDAERATATRGAVGELLRAVERDTNLFADGETDAERLKKVHAAVGALIAAEDEGSEESMAGKPLNDDDIQKMTAALTKSIIDHAMAEFKKATASPAPTPVDELEARIVEALKITPGLERRALEVQIYADDPAFAKRLAEYLATRDLAHDAALAAMYARAHASFGLDVNGNIVTKGHAVTELDRRARAAVQKSNGTISYIDALNAASIADPALERAARQAVTVRTTGGTVAEHLTKSGSASAEVQARVDALMQKNARLDVAGAQAQIFKDDPALLDRVRAEYVSV